MIAFIKGLFSSGVVGAVERIASEAIETDLESAEAKALWIKTLDPNGLMRRELSSFACKAYAFYLLIASILVLGHSFGFTNPDQSSEAIAAMTELFLPITTAWGTIVTASFGVNTANVFKGK